MNEYTPWIELGLTEVEYWKKRYLEARAEAEQVKRVVEAARFLMSFVPEWANNVPDGLCATMYGTLSAEGDRKVKARVDEIRALLASLDAPAGAKETP